MKTNELMIGDWVIFHDSGYASDGTTWEENRVCQIDSIDEDVRVKWYDESGYKEDWPHISTVCLSPIPLTPEILEKNGFLANEHVYPYPYYEYEVKENKVKVGFAFPQGNRTSYKEPWVCIDTECVYIEHLPCIFVHQLQHALRLCGIKKEIEL